MKRPVVVRNDKFPPLDFFTQWQRVPFNVTDCALHIMGMIEKHIPPRAALGITHDDEPRTK